MKKNRFSDLVRSFDLKTLFNELGWGNFGNKLPVGVDDDLFELVGIAEKKGFVVLHCSPDKQGKIPVSNIRKQIEVKVGKLYFEHLIIYTDRAQQHQIWQLALKEENKPRQVREVSWYSHQDTEVLFQRMKNLLFTVDEEDSITIVDVKQRISENFASNTEQVTKKFYTEFKRQHGEFLDFIQGIDDHLPSKDNTNKQWYASLMLNRLMFCYFIQKKGFLNQDVHYLRNKLKACEQLEGHANFYSFYRSFLMELFHDGLGKPEAERHHESPLDLGKIPYLNGGLFDVHELEQQFAKIEIGDEAFQHIFDFFDKWNWHLDNSIEATGRDINPDVIGYIFEKYINDRAAMGAYYTKEDITDYIGKNTILPFLFDETERQYKKAFKPDGELWQFLKFSRDTYIYDAVKKGVPATGGLFEDLPEEIRDGFRPDLEKEVVDSSTSPRLWEIRKVWNQRAPEAIALPTELYRELIERRKRYAEVRAGIEKGEITHINDFITYNLNIRQFAQDFLQQTQDAEFVRHFFQAIQQVTILDPTCGSGAFLFAALNILEPLYEACLMRMEQWVAEQPGKHKKFEEVLAEVNSPQHPHQRYYIYKSIILHNLYGVDIMKEAVEIAKLRLFLKLVATVDVNPRKPNYGLEPLPDIDFNIRAGNTLVGFATEKELLRAVQADRHGQYRTGYEKVLAKFTEDCKLVSQAYERFQNSQQTSDQGSESFKKAKQTLNNWLKQLNEGLSEYLADTYGITKYEELGGNTQLFNNPNTIRQETKEYKAWLTSHQPFHWFAEFYQIIAGSGGFDVIIGNPPYVEYSKVKRLYSLKDYETLACGNIFAQAIERSSRLNNSEGTMGMIVPSSSICTPRMAQLFSLEMKDYRGRWITCWDERPGKLFGEVDQQLAIHILSRSNVDQLKLSSMIHWNRYERGDIFQAVRYADYASGNLIAEVVPKIQMGRELLIMEKLRSGKSKFLPEVQVGGNQVELYFRNAGGRYWKLIKSFPAYYRKAGERNPSLSSTEVLTTVSKRHRDSVISIFSSNLFYWYWRVVSNCRHLTQREMNSFPIRPDLLNVKAISQTGREYEEGLKSNSRRLLINNVHQDVFYVVKSKSILDRIDVLLSEHYGFTEEELDFIINYDIKYRMGKALFGEEEEGEEEEV